MKNIAISTKKTFEKSNFQNLKKKILLEFILDVFLLAVRRRFCRFDDINSVRAQIVGHRCLKFEFFQKKSKKDKRASKIVK